MKAGISKSNSKFDNYRKWLESGKVDYIILDWEQNNFDDIKQCSSLLLTGGNDIYPEFYSNLNDGNKQGDYIPERDKFEFKLLDYALYNNLPVLGICRGMQLINCKMGGSLIGDIETERGLNHRKISQTEDRIHNVNISENSLMYEVVHEISGLVNSSHHQAVNRLGDGLEITAKADDGIIEGIEWESKENKPFMLGIQWHPERTSDKESPFSKNILERFKNETTKKIIERLN